MEAFIVAAITYGASAAVAALVFSLLFFFVDGGDIILRIKKSIGYGVLLGLCWPWVLYIIASDD